MVDVVDGMVTISKKEYDELLDDSFFLECLTGAGVDNWEGYDYALKKYQKQGN